jgi:hypothetical protein
MEKWNDGSCAPNMERGRDNSRKDGELRNGLSRRAALMLVVTCRHTDESSRINCIVKSK